MAKLERHRVESDQNTTKQGISGNISLAQAQIENVPLK